MRKPQHRHPDSIRYKSKLWRYMSMAKFISMLKSQQLHFCRVDRLDDPKEAMFSPRFVRHHVSELLKNEEIKRILGDRTDGELIAQLQFATSEMKLRASIFVNCWYQSEDESVAMWKLYGDQGVAVQSTWERMAEAIPDFVGVGPVLYTDYDALPFDSNMPYFCKHRSYEHEREVRAFVYAPPRESSNLSVNRDHPTIHSVDVNLKRLIKRVYVAPGSGKWMTHVVEDVLGRYGLGTKDVILSGAGELPEYRRLFNDATAELYESAFPLEPNEFDELGNIPALRLRPNPDAN